MRIAGGVQSPRPKVGLVLYPSLGRVWAGPLGVASTSIPFGATFLSVSPGSSPYSTVI